MVPITNNSYITSNTYDTANPIKSQVYSSNINNDKQSSDTCKTIEKSKISGKWKSWFNSNCKEIIYSNSQICSYTIIMDILTSAGITNKTIGLIKADLLSEYKKLFDQGHRDMIYLILEKQGKVTSMKRIKREELRFEDYVLSEKYYLTNLDIWLLSIFYNLGISIISSTKLIENNDNILPLVYPEDGKYYFIKSGGIYNDIIPKYKLIVDDKNNNQFIFTELERKLQTKILSTKTLTGKGYTLEKHLTEFKPHVYKQNKRVVKKLKLVKPGTSSEKKPKKKSKKIKLVKN